MDNKINYGLYYDKYHKENKQYWKNQKYYYLNTLGLLKHLPPSKESKILDIGSGKGALLQIIKELGYKNIEGIDVDEGLVQYCVSKGLNCHLINHTADFLKDNEEEYDLITCIDVLEHIPHQEQIEFITCIKNSLTNNGVFICQVPNASASLSMRHRYNDWTHHIAFTENSLAFLLMNCGFFVDSVSGINVYKPQYFWQFKKMIRYSLVCLINLLKKIEYVVELGYYGFKVPLSINIYATARKKNL